MSNFTDQIKKFILEVNTKETEVIKNIRIGVSESIIDKTPYDTITPGDGGQAKASWVATIGTQGRSNDSEKDKDGSETKNKAAQVAKSNIDEDFYLTSTCDYIGVLEYGGYPNPPKKGTYLKGSQSKDGISGPGHHVFSEGGYSAKAPRGMVRITVADFQNIVADATKSLK